MADSVENILVEFDYNNISIIDPNKVLDENGRAKERLVRHEDLVMYANLECKVLPRTKLIIGASNADNLRTISVTSINFLNPGEKTFIDNAYTDEITGKDTLKGEGVNQRKISIVPPFKGDKTEQYYYSQATMSNKEFKATDNGLLGIKSISVKQGLDFEPVINIKLEDVKGKALFESGNDSPYAAFFNLPYPLFYLTIKGYYGKALRLPLMLQDFNSTYNPGTGNFEIDLTLFSYKYSMISEVSIASLVATPRMYKSTVQKTPKNKTGGLPAILNTNKTVKNEVVRYGTQKIKEVYSEYKSKGLIPDDFPEITVVQMQKRLDQFITEILETFTKVNLDPLTNLSEYKDNLGKYRGDVIDYYDSWFKKWMDEQSFFILNVNKSGQNINLSQEKTKIYAFKKEFEAAKISTDTAISELTKIIQFYNEKLKKNETCGEGGSYTIDGKVTPCEITNKITTKIFLYTELLESKDIDFTETYKQRNNNAQPDQTALNNLANEFELLNQTQGITYKDEDGEKVPKSTYFIFEGKERFVNLMDEMSKILTTKRTEIEKALTESLAKLIKQKNTPLGFIPTIRNVMAVMFANGEAFFRLLDEVHTKAWNQRDSPIRLAPIFSTKANPDSTQLKTNAETGFVYPWPEFIKEGSGEKGKPLYVTKYPGDPEVINETKGFLYDQWPEVEFVEEYIKALSETKDESSESVDNNQVTDTRRISLNGIEYPTNNEVFSNKEETKFFFEIYERLMLYSYYSKISRTVDSTQDLSKIIPVVSEIEKTNIVESLAAQSPFLVSKLVNYPDAMRSEVYLSTLRQFSNQGVGQSWQNFIRGIFNTSYISNLAKNGSFTIKKINSDNKTTVLGTTVNENDIVPTISFEREDDIKTYLSASTTSNNADFTDTFPFVDAKWNRKYLAGNSPVNPQALNSSTLPFIPPPTPQKEFMDTRKNLVFNTSFKVIANFSSPTLITPLGESITQEAEPKPFSSYNFLNITQPSTGAQNTAQPEFNLNDLEEFYKERKGKYNIQLPTEGSVNYLTKPGLLTKNQTTSILNTPYFVNSIQESIFKFRNFDNNPFVVPGYLLINSLPISTLREKYTKYLSNAQQSQDSVEYMNYIFATFKKFGAIHKMPYAWVLKIGSVWHRYKHWAQTGVDIIENSWKNFDYLGSFDPISSALTTTYSLTLDNGQNVDIALDKNTPIGPQTFSQLNTGFYPQTINDFNVLYQGFRLFTDYTNSDIQNGISSGLTLVNSSDANITMDFSGDPANPNRFIQLNAWSAYVVTLDKKSCFLLPSHGANINQVKQECFKDGVKKIEVSGNDVMYNGSVRTYWAAPNYGYFDVYDIVKPRPDEYMKKVFGGIKTQENFSLNSGSGKYTKISEMFSVFEKSVLDEFEKYFLDWTISKYNYSDVPLTATETEKSYGNFQLFLTSLMKVPAPDTGATPYDKIKFIQSEQNKNFTKLIAGFLSYDVLIKHGNPSSFDKRLFYSFSNKQLEDKFVFKPYSVLTPNSLPNSAGTISLASSRLNYPEAWKKLIEYVGFSEIPEIEYTDTGSTIFDFFIDTNVAFLPENVEICAPIIKIYATQKLKNKTLTDFDFRVLMDAYIDKCNYFINKNIDEIFPNLTKSLDGIKIIKDNTETNTSNTPQAKLELYQTFKAINDKWISGNDFKVRTLFEDVLFFDRASRDIGDVVIVDIYQLRDLLDPKKINMSSNMLIFVNSILKQNNFQVMNIPAFVNYYGVQDATKNPIPKPEGTTEFANTLFGTFTNVDYQNSSTKMVCFYGNRVSTQLDTQGIIDGWKNDSFDLRKASDNPMIEEQTGKKDWAKSNKVVGFNVDLGPQNQGVFKTFSVSQKNNTPTAESLQILSEMSKQAGNRNVATQNLSLYNLYKLRSYECQVGMMGNAMIQPMMFFNLRYVPMFSGPYMITEVTHQIQPGEFTTSASAIRQPLAVLPDELDLIQTLKVNLVDNIIKEYKVKEEARKSADSKNEISDRAKIVTNSTGKSEITTIDCSGITKYSTYTKKDKVNTTQTSFKNAKTVINNVAQKLGIPTQNIQKLAYAVFAQMTLQSGNGTNFQGIENNYIGIDLNSNWGASEQYFIGNTENSKKYFCVTRGDNVFPYVAFESLEKNIEFLLSRWKLRASSITSTSAEDIAIFVNTNLKPNSVSPNEWYSLSKEDKDVIIGKVQTAINVYNQTI